MEAAGGSWRQVEAAGGSWRHLEAAGGSGRRSQARSHAGREGLEKELVQFSAEPCSTVRHQGYCHARAGGMAAYLLDTRLHHLQGYRHASFGMLWIDLGAQQLPRIKELGSTKIPYF